MLTLLADEDPVVYQPVLEKILLCGPSVVEWLRPHMLSREPALRRHAQEIVRRLGREAADNAFLSFCLKHGEEFDLEEGAWLLAQTQYPETNPEAYRALLDSYANDLRTRVDFTAEPKQFLVTINHYLFQELGFAGNDETCYDPEDSYLNRVINRRTGSSVSLCLLYLFLARQLRMPVAIIGLPGQFFICRYQSAAGDFYLDVFNAGRLLTKAACVQYLVQGSFSVRDDYMAPVSARLLLLRVCASLHQIYLKLQLAGEATRLQRYLVALAR